MKKTPVNTGMFDDNNTPIYTGDKLYSIDDYFVIVMEKDNHFYGKLVCIPGDPCENVHYALNGGNGYLIIKFKEN